MNTTAWMNKTNQTITWTKPTIFNNEDGSVTHIALPTDEQLASYGYVPVETPDVSQDNLFIDYDNETVHEILVETTPIEVPIDAETKAVADQFAGMMMLYFGADALTNTAITEKAVTMFFAAKVAAGTITALELAHASLLERYFTVLKESPYNPSKGTTWEFPFGQETVPSATERRYYLNGGEKVYLD